MRRSCSCYSDRIVSIKWLVDVSYNYGILLRRYLPLRCLKRFLFPFFAHAICKIFSESSTILTGFYFCGTSEPRLKISCFSWKFPSSLLPVLYFQWLPYVLWIRQGEILISLMDPPSSHLTFQNVDFWDTYFCVLTNQNRKFDNFFLLFLSILEKPNRFIVWLVKSRGHKSNFCAVPTNIFNVVIVVFLPYKKCLLNLLAPSRKRRVHVRFTGHSRTVGPRYENLPCVTHLAPRIWLCLLDLWKIYGTLV